MLTKQQCALLKTVPTKQQVVGNSPTKPKEVEVEVSMAQAYQQFCYAEYKRNKSN
jgi:hypothetical protein